MLFTMIDHRRLVSGHRYEFDPRSSSLNPDIKNAEEWAIEHFGQITGLEHESRWWILNGKYFWFRHLDDAMMFKMRWC